MSNSFQKELTNYLLRTKLSIPELAKILGIDKGAVQSWLVGTTQPKTHIAEAILSELKDAGPSSN